MNKKDRILYLILAVMFIGYVVVEHYKPKPINWEPSFSQHDKDPYGSYILYEELESFFHSGKQVSFQTLYELQDSAGQLMILAISFEGSKEDQKAIYKKLEAGDDVFIAANFFGESFLDTLGLKEGEWLSSMASELGDSIDIVFGKANAKVNYPPSIAAGTLLPADTSGWEVLAKVKDPVLIKKKIKNGNLILCSTPLAFTNYGVLHDNGQQYVAMALNQLRDGAIIYNRFYFAGRGESTTPLRYLVSQPALKWALYLTVLILLVLLIIGSQRRQRAIPLMDPKANTTVRFIKTMGALYYREGNHKNAGEKLISHFLKALSERYYLSQFFSEEAYATLASKTGLQKTEVVETFTLIQTVRNTPRISEETLKSLNEKIAQFNLK